jgi:hypothetical protein
MEKPGIEPSAESELCYLFNLYVCNNKKDTYLKREDLSYDLLCQFLLVNFKALLLIVCNYKCLWSYHWLQVSFLQTALLYI